MGLPYENATSGKKAITDMQSMLRDFGCSKFSHGEDYKSGDVFIQFEHRGRMVHMTANSRGYAKLWLKQNPWSRRRTYSQFEWEKRALDKGAIAVYSMLRDWVKAQIMLIEAGITSFNAVFLSYMLTANGQTLLDVITEQKMLPADIGDIDVSE